MPQALFERILLPIASEADAEATCAVIESYIDPDTSQLIVVHVIEKTESYPDKAPIGARQEQASDIFEIIRERCADTSHSVRTELRYGTDVVEEIFAFADEANVTAVGVTPRPGRRWIKLLAGNHGAKLISNNRVPVVVFPRPDALSAHE